MASAIQQRPLRGSRISSFYPVKTLPPLSSLDSAFQLQEYISLLIRLDVHDVDSIVSLPSNKPANENSGEERKSELAVDEACWIYEQLRRLAQDLSHPLITTLQQECTRTTCPEMKAGEWLYLCVAHGNDGTMEQCCAIDYILHTLDSATALLNSPRAFPSRLNIPPASHRHFPALARRLGRIFAHAYFHHREAFEQAEVESSLYARFLSLVSKFGLVPPDFLVIPMRGVGDGFEGEGDVPRLGGASVGSNYDSQEQEHQQNLTSEQLEWGQRERSKSPPGLGLGVITGTESPRKMGRNRTDTMVFSEGFNVAEELAKQEAEINGLGLPVAPTGYDATEDIESALGTSDTGPVLASTDPSSPTTGTRNPHSTQEKDDAFDPLTLRPLPEPISGEVDEGAAFEPEPVPVPNPHTGEPTDEHAPKPDEFKEIDLLEEPPRDVVNLESAEDTHDIQPDNDFAHDTSCNEDPDPVYKEPSAVEVEVSPPPSTSSTSIGQDAVTGTIPEVDEERQSNEAQEDDAKVAGEQQITEEKSNTAEQEQNAHEGQGSDKVDKVNESAQEEKTLTVSQEKPEEVDEKES